LGESQGGAFGMILIFRGLTIMAADGGRAAAAMIG
jgi:hypothetical protein